jgi:cyclic beta-1,2-glucan synthetase
MLACMVNREAAEENLRRMAVNGLLTRHGFYESADYSGGGQPEIVRSHMVHHQAMGLMALANALLGAPMQERFHADPIVQATEYLLQERLQALIQVAPELTIERPRVRKTVNAEEAHSAHAAAARPN